MTSYLSLQSHCILVIFCIAEPNPPVDLNITVEELNLVATWNEPFTLEGEELLYIVTITNTASGVQEEVTVNTTRHAFSKSFGERDCAEYQFTVFSENDYSKSMINVSEWKNIPTGTQNKEYEVHYY